MNAETRPLYIPTYTHTNSHSIALHPLEYIWPIEAAQYHLRITESQRLAYSLSVSGAAVAVRAINGASVNARNHPSLEKYFINSFPLNK